MMAVQHPEIIALSSQQKISVND